MTKHYKVILTECAFQQIQEISFYISKVLSAPETARECIKKIYRQISLLKSMPRRHALLDMEPWHSRGIRKTAVQNFLIYYWVDETTVWITAVIYGKRDQLEALRQLS